MSNFFHVFFFNVLFNKSVFNIWFKYKFINKMRCLGTSSIIGEYNVPTDKTVLWSTGAVNSVELNRDKTGCSNNDIGCKELADEGTRLDKLAFVCWPGARDSCGDNSG